MVVELATSEGPITLNFDKIMDLCADFDAEPEDMIAVEIYRKTKLRLSEDDLARVAAEYRKYEAEIFAEWDLSDEDDEF